MCGIIVIGLLWMAFLDVVERGQIVLKTFGHNSFFELKQRAPFNLVNNN
jgi:hypothetical protein